MDRLWTPWRYAYISGGGGDGRKGVPAELAGWPAEADTGCVFCNLIAAADWGVAQGMDVDAVERSVGLIERGESCFVCLNAFPYASGHVMVVPYAHVDSLAALPVPTAEEMIRTAQRVELALRAEYRPDGLNLGMNLGKAGGAGVSDHVHLHALPRWTGDTNFMTVTADTRILPETLDVSWEKLRSRLRSTTLK